MPTAFDQQDLDATLEQVNAKITAEREDRSILSKALDIIASLTGGKRVSKATDEASLTQEDPVPAAPAADPVLHKSDESHVHVHMHNGTGADEEEHGDEDADGMTMEEDRDEDAAMADAIVNDILEIFEQHYARHDKGGAAMDKSRSTESDTLTHSLIKSFVHNALQAQTTYEARFAALEKSLGTLAPPTPAPEPAPEKSTPETAMARLEQTLVQLSTTQEAISKSLAALAEAQEMRDSQPQPSRYEAVRQTFPAGGGQRIAQGFDKKRAVEALSKGLIVLNSPEYRDWKYRGIVPEAVQHPLG